MRNSSLWSALLLVLAKQAQVAVSSSAAEIFPVGTPAIETVQSTIDGSKRVAIYRMITSYLRSNGYHEEMPLRDQHRIAVHLKQDVLSLVGDNDEIFSSGDFELLFSKAIKMVNIDGPAIDLEEPRVADRYVQHMLEAIEDPDCMEREFDVSSEDFDAEDASMVLKKCRLLVLRNVFDKDFLHAYRKNFTNYVHSINTGAIDPLGKTSNGDGYYMHMVDTGRTELIVPKELAHKELMANPAVMKVVSHPGVLGHNMVVHSLGSALAEPGAKGQTWHRDQGFLLGGDSLINHGLAGQDLPPHVFNAFVPLVPEMTHAHGPTEFCMGSAWVDGVPYDDVEYYDDPSLFEEIEDYVEYGEDGCPPRFWRSPKPNFGDMILFDYQLLHRGGRNLSDQMRAVMYATYSRDWYKDGNFKQKDAEYVEFDSVTPENQQAATDMMIQTTRFSHPASMTCGGSMSECLSGEPSVTLEEIIQFLPHLRIQGSDRDEEKYEGVVEFNVANIDLDVEGGVQIVDLNATVPDEKLIITLYPGYYSFLEANAGTTLQAQTSDGTPIKTWKLMSDQDQVIISQSNMPVKSS